MEAGSACARPFCRRADIMNVEEPCAVGPAQRERRAGRTHAIESVAPPDDHLPLRVLLAFSSQQYERRFVDHYVAFYFRYVQAALVLGVLLVLGDFGVDFLGLSGVPSNILRLQLCVPVLLIALAYSFLPVAKRHWQPVMSGFIVTMALCTFWILLRIDDEGGVGLRSWVGILNFTFLEFYCFVILGVQFRIALGAGLLILVAFEAAMAAHSGLPARAVAYWSYHVVTLFMLSAGVGWWREYLLRQEFSARTSLIEARASAEDLARLKGDFLATMSHEIRTPMNGVLGMTELLLDSALSDTQRRHAETIRSSGEALLTILNDILDLSKIEAGKVELEPIEMDPRALGEEAVQLLALQAQQKGLDLSWRVAADVPARVRGDPTRLRQILLNLLGNAIKFTDAGEVTLSIERERESDAVQAVDLGRCLLRFSVRDDGIGVRPEARARLFQPFVQADGSTTRRYGGTGLGLVVCKQLTEMMGGSIGVESEPDCGSTFWFTTRTAVVEAGPPAPLANLDGKRVLVVDHRRSRSLDTREQVEAMGGECIVAPDGTRALAELRDAVDEGRPFAVALIENQIPAMSGGELVRAVRDDARLRDTACVLLCSLAEVGRAEEASSTDADRILSRPVRRAELAATLGVLCGDASIEVVRVPSARIATRLQGRVLLVEDNAINRTVATALLARLGVEVITASNGDEGVKRACAASGDVAFDVVLMDCQMPGMDGFEASRRIRAWERKIGCSRPLPIVALTANAMAGDREICLAAGMTDYLTKPFTGAQLGATLSRLLLTKEPPCETSASAHVVANDSLRDPSGDVAAVFDSSVLASLPMVADGSEPGFATEVLEEFLVHGGLTVDLCRSALAAGELSTTLRSVHTLKSSAAQVGALRIARLAGVLETRLRGGEPLDEATMTTVEDEHRRACTAIRSHLDAGAAAAALPA
jgi:signal transduction histidine kinase/CheY-like chemotaxis protein